MHLNSGQKLPHILEEIYGWFDPKTFDDFRHGAPYLRGWITLIKSSLKFVQVIHTQVIEKAKKLEIENINFINGGLTAEVSIIVDELEFYGCRIWRDEAGRAASVVSVPEIMTFRTARCAVPVIKVSEEIKRAIAVLADDILPKVKPCRFDQLNHPPSMRLGEADLLNALARVYKKKRWTMRLG